MYIIIGFFLVGGLIFYLTSCKNSTTSAKIHKPKERITRIDNLETLLSSVDMTGSIIELDNFIGELCSYGDEMAVLTEPQKQFYYNQCLEREVNNGGFSQYFYNSSGGFAHQTVISLRTIGANITAEILQNAIDQFPNKNVPQDRAERQDILEKIQDTAEPIWEELDKKFFEYQDDLNTLNFVRQNKNDF